DGAIFVTNRRDTRDVKAISALAGPDPVLDLARRGGRKALLEGAPELFVVVRVHGREGACAPVAQRLLLAQTGELHPLIVDPLDASVGGARPDDLGQRVCELLVARIADVAARPLVSDSRNPYSRRHVREIRIPAGARQAPQCFTTRRCPDTKDA